MGAGRCPGLASHAWGVGPHSAFVFLFLWCLLFFSSTDPSSNKRTFPFLSFCCVCLSDFLFGGGISVGRKTGVGSDGGGNGSRRSF